MSIIGSIRIALRSLGANKLRSGLTMLGVIIGVTAVILLVSIGEGVRSDISRRLMELGSNLLIIAPGKTPMSSSPVNELTYEDALEIKKRVRTIARLSPVMEGTGEVKYFDRRRDTSILGVTPDYQFVRNQHAEVGSFISEEDVDGTRNVCALGRTVKGTLFGTKNPLGKKVTVMGRKLRVVGVMEAKGATMAMDEDDRIFVPITTAEELFDLRRLNFIVVTAANTELIEEATKEIRRVLIKRHNNKEDFNIMSQAQILSTMKTVLSILTLALGAIAGISLLVGGIGIMNIMLVSVTERTREIGIRKAVGAKNRDILKQFIVEALTLSLIGGTLGIIAGAGIAALIPKAVSTLPTKVSLWSVLTAFGFSAFVGVFFGVYPAYKASRLDPIVALRYE